MYMQCGGGGGGGLCTCCVLVWGALCHIVHGGYTACCAGGYTVCCAGAIYCVLCRGDILRDVQGDVLIHRGIC